MGRELRRVPLDFNHPLREVWVGYINPHPGPVSCLACDGTGYSPRAKLFSDQWYGNAPFDPVEYGATPLTVDNPRILALAERNVAHSPGFYGADQYAVRREQHRLFRDCFRGHWSHHLIQADVDALIEDDRLWDFTRVPRTPEQVEAVKAKMAAGGNSWLPESNGYTPTADEVNQWSIGGMGHDSINRWICIKARCARESVPVECQVCNGEDVWGSDEARSLYESWESYEPPTGPGYQLWETTSEGSPVSPVFATLDELCAYAESHCTVIGTVGSSGSVTKTAAEWRAMLGSDSGLVTHAEQVGDRTMVFF